MKELGISPDLYKEIRRAGQYSIDKVFAHLVKEPYGVQFDQLERLTPVIVKHVYFRDPDRDEPTVLPPAVSHRQDCLAKGMTEEQIQASWQELMDKDDVLRQLHTPT